MSSNVIQLISNVEQAFLTFPGYIQFSSYIYTIFQYSILKVPATTFPNATISISSHLEHPEGFRDIPLLGAAVEDGVVHDFIRGKMPIPFHLLTLQIRSRNH